MTFKFKKVIVKIFGSESAKKFVVTKLGNISAEIPKVLKNNVHNNVGLGSHQTKPTWERESN